MNCPKCGKRLKHLATCGECGQKKHYRFQSLWLIVCDCVDDFQLFTTFLPDNEGTIEACYLIPSEKME